MSKAVETCSETTWDGWRSHPCRRPVRRDGLCGPHAAGRDRHIKAEADRAAKSQERKRLDGERDARQRALLDAEATVVRVRALADEWEQIGGNDTAAVAQWHAAAEWLRRTLTEEPSA